LAHDGGDLGLVQKQGLILLISPRLRVISRINKCAA
jgi:hypothetical protein